MRGLVRRLNKLEGQIVAHDGANTSRFRELVARLSTAETRGLHRAIRSNKESEGAEEDRQMIQAMLALAQERLNAGLIIVRERKPAGAWNDEIRTLRRVYGPDAWRYASFYDEYLVPVDGNPN